MQNWMGPDSFSSRCYEDSDRHCRAIDKLVCDLGITAEEVTRSYYAVLDELKKDITVRAFLPLVVSIRVKERLLRRQRTDLPVQPSCCVDFFHQDGSQQGKNGLKNNSTGANLLTEK